MNLKPVDRPLLALGLLMLSGMVVVAAAYLGMWVLMNLFTF